VRSQVTAVFLMLALISSSAAGQSAETASPNRAQAPAKTTPDAKAGGASPPAASSPPEQPLPYEGQLLRLAEIMGALSYLRDLCGYGDGDAFRSKTTALIHAGGISEARQDLLAGAYNRGYEGYRLTYRVCTSAASDVIARYLSEAAEIASDVGGRYGG